MKVDKVLFLDTLQECDGNLTRCAKRLGVHRRTATRCYKKWEHLYKGRKPRPGGRASIQRTKLREAISNNLTKKSFNKSAVARELGVTRRSVRRWTKIYVREGLYNKSGSGGLYDESF